MTDYDNPWKEALDEFFIDALELLYPVAHAEIDWPRGFEFLDTNCKKLIRVPNMARGLWTGSSRSG